MESNLEKLNKRLPLTVRFTLLALVVSLVMVGFVLLLEPHIESRWLLLSISVLISALVARWLAGIWTKPIISLINALLIRVDSYRDNDFSTSLNAERSDEFLELFKSHNELGDLLRKERQDIFQRELLLDTVIQNSPQIMLLTDDKDRILYANLAARQFFAKGQRLEHRMLNEVLEDKPELLCNMIENHTSGLVSIEEENDVETWHLSCSRFELNARFHQLYLIKQLTRELSREEVKVWKKLIRVISHELNNSLAPIRSLAHSAEKLIEQNNTDKLAGIMQTISERSDYLKDFIDGYASFARLPTPNIQEVNWSSFLDSLMQLCEFKLTKMPEQEHARFDPIQMQQVLINLLKNAAESGSELDQVMLNIEQSERSLVFIIKDRGAGMSDKVLSNALLPFYSTKRTGTGIGLSLSREIIEAHQGKINLANRKHGGLTVRLQIPQ